jgi:hypothetical protein
MELTSEYHFDDSASAVKMVSAVQCSAVQCSAVQCSANSKDLLMKQTKIKRNCTLAYTPSHTT